MIQLDYKKYWLYAVVDPDTNELLHTQLEPTTNSVLAQQFLAQLREKHDVDDILKTLVSDVRTRRRRLVNAVFLIDGSCSLKDACSRHGLDLRVECHRDFNSLERFFREVKRQTSWFSNCFSNAEAETADE